MQFLKSLTIATILLAVVGLSLFDVYIFWRGGTEATISWTIFEWSHKYPMIPFAVGVLCGHFFWQMKPFEKMKQTLAKE